MSVRKKRNRFKSINLFTFGIMDDNIIKINYEKEIQSYKTR